VRLLMTPKNSFPPPDRGVRSVLGGLWLMLSQEPGQHNSF
jgi:hypothetical protein